MPHLHRLRVRLLTRIVEQLNHPGDQELVTVAVAASDCSRWFRTVFELLLPI